MAEKLRREVATLGRFEAHRVGDEVVYFDPEPHLYYDEIRPNKSGGYSFVKGSNLIGCSTPVKALDTDTDQLMWWVAKFDQIGIAELIGRALDNDAPLDWMREPATIGRALREAELTWWHVRKRAARRGSRIHELIFLALAQEKRPPSLSRLSAEERGYGQAAIRWWREHEPTPIYAEQVTLCRGHRVAGRFDLLCEIGGERVLVDAKTREKGAVRLGDHAQLAGYEMCNEACGLGSSDRRVALILKPDGTYVAHDGLGTEADFIAALEAYRRGRELSKRMDAAEKAKARKAETSGVGWPE